MSSAQALCSPVFASREYGGLPPRRKDFSGGELTVRRRVRGGRRGDRRGTTPQRPWPTLPRDGRHTGIGGTPGGGGRSGLAPYCTSETLPLRKITFISL